MPLELGATYFATVNTGARSAAGVSLAADVRWNFTITACDNRPITGLVVPSTDVLWPPDHSMWSVGVDVSGLVPQKPEVTYAIAGVDVAEYSTRASSQGTYTDVYFPDEFEPDFEITGPLSLNLRAERVGNSQGRTYTIHVVASDCSGDYPFDVRVEVPHDQGN